MKSQNRSYLVDTKCLSPEECIKTKNLLDTACWMCIPLAKNPSIFMAHTSYSADEFEAIPLPNGCIVTDVTGQDLLAYC